MRIPLAAIDKNLERFAEEIGATISKDETKGGWLPDKFEERTLKWSANSFHYTISIFPILHNEQVRKWSLGGWCVYHEGKDSYSVNRIFIETRRLNKIIANIDQLLSEALSYLKTLKLENLEKQRRPPHPL